jgi:hypothetical protein
MARVKIPVRRVIYHHIQRTAEELTQPPFQWLLFPQVNQL